MSTYKAYQESLERYFKARQEHDKVHDEFEGVSWDYHGWPYIEEMEKAQEECRKLFQELIREEVQNVLQGKCV